MWKKFVWTIIVIILTITTLFFIISYINNMIKEDIARFSEESIFRTSENSILTSPPLWFRGLFINYEDCMAACQEECTNSNFGCTNSCIDAYCD